MKCPRCPSIHTLSLSPVFSFTLGWFGKVRRVQSGWVQGCWACGAEFVVTTRGETIQREAQSAPPLRMTPRQQKREEPPRETLVDEDFIPEPGFRP